MSTNSPLTIFGAHIDGPNATLPTDALAELVRCYIECHGSVVWTHGIFTNIWGVDMTTGELYAAAPNDKSPRESR